MHTTPPSPVDMPQFFPALIPYARTTIRLHPRRGAPTATQSSVGGPLLWPADEPWSMCAGPNLKDHLDFAPGPAEVPLVPIAQVFAEDAPDVPFPAGTDVLQVLWCPFDHEPWRDPRPEVRWRRRADIGPTLYPMPTPDQDANPEFVPRPCLVDPEAVTEYPTFDLPREAWDEIEDAVEQVEATTGWQYDTDLAVASGIKIGGYPGWTQSPDWPICACGISMEHLLTAASWEFSNADEKRWIPLEDRPTATGSDDRTRNDHPWPAIQNPTGLMLGDAGGVYIFVCTTCPERPFDYRFDCS